MEQYYVRSPPPDRDLMNGEQASPNANNQPHYPSIPSPRRGDKPNASNSQLKLQTDVPLLPATTYGAPVVLQTPSDLVSPSEYYKPNPRLKKPTVLNGAPSEISPKKTRSASADAKPATQRNAGRKPSLKDLVDKFEQKAPVPPSHKRFESASSTSSTEQRGYRSRQGSNDMTADTSRSPVKSRLPIVSQRKASVEELRKRPERPRLTTSKSSIAEGRSGGGRPLLFGEMSPNAIDTHTPGFGIPLRPRSGSEGGLSPTSSIRSYSESHQTPTSPKWDEEDALSLDAIASGSLDQARARQNARNQVNLPSPIPESASPQTPVSRQSNQPAYETLSSPKQNLSKTSPRKGSAIPTQSPGQAKPQPVASSPASVHRGTSRTQPKLAEIRLQAVVDIPEPKPSPPLRSSRPRIPVSAATTASSRGKVSQRYTPHASAARKQLQERNRRPPDLGTIDFAARRERVQKEFSKNLAESDRKEEAREIQRRRAAAREENAELPLDPLSKVKPKLLAQTDTSRFSTTSGLSTTSGDLPIMAHPALFAQFTEPAIEEAAEELEHNGLGLQTMPHLVSDKSVPLPNMRVEEPHSPQNDSLAGSDQLPQLTLDTLRPMVYDPKQKSPQKGRQKSPEEIAISRSVLSQIMGMRHEDISPADTPAIPQDTDLGTIRVMLGDTPGIITGSPLPTAEEIKILEAFQSVAKNNAPSESRFESNPEVQRTIELLSKGHTQDSPQEDDMRIPGQWESPPNTTHSSVASNGYDIVLKVLQQYHDPELVSPELVHNVQKKMLSSSPELAKKGTWEYKRITDFYLQYLAQAKIVHNEPVPPLRRLETDRSKWTIEPGMGPNFDLPTPETEVSFGDLALRNPYIDDSEGSDLTWNSRRQSLEVPSAWNSRPVSFAQSIEEEPEYGEHPPTPPPKDWAATIGAAIKSRGRQSMADASHLLQIQEGRVDKAKSPTLPRIDTGPSISSIHGLFSPVDEKGSPGFSDSKGNFKAGLLVSSPVDRLSSSQYSEKLDGAASTKTTDSKEPHLDSSAASGKAVSTAETSVESAEKVPSPSQEQKNLTKRRHILKELVDTEKVFQTDMSIIKEIYQATANDVRGLSAENAKILFGNIDQVLEFSRVFLESLILAVASLYVVEMPTGVKARKSGSNHVTKDSFDGLAGTDFTEEEKDRMTFIGEAFGHNLARMEKVFAVYSKNHEAASIVLQKILRHKSVNLWLQQCHNNSKDLTGAWSLDSLLVKPVQRLLKYPLLLNSLVEVTPDDHPDYTALTLAAEEITKVSFRINESKKRHEIVEKATGRKRKDSDAYHGIQKAINRRAEKIRQQVGLSEMVEDQEYNVLITKFHEYYMQLQVAMRDVEGYVRAVQVYVETFVSLTKAFEIFIDVHRGAHPVIESRWRKFSLCVREMASMALPGHQIDVRKKVITPLVTAIKLHEAPSLLMMKREKKMIDYARWKAIKDRGDKPDKLTQERAEEFMGLNDTLKDELPKLFTLTTRLVETCLESFIHLQMLWQDLWQDKIAATLEDQQVPATVKDILDHFNTDFPWAEQPLKALAIVNGSLLDRPLKPSVSTPSISTPERNHNDIGFRGPPISYNNRNRSASAMSPRSNTPRNDHDSDKRNSQGSASSFPIGRQIQPHELLSYANIYNSRGASPASHSSNPPSMPDRPPPALPRERNSGSTFYSASQDRGTDSPSPAASPNLQQEESLQPLRGGFSSAVPMEETLLASPRMEEEPPSPPGQDYNVLFLAASLFEFKINKERSEAGFPYLTYDQGDIFDVIGEKGELWLAKNQDDSANQVGWIWCKHFAKLAS